MQHLFVLWRVHLGFEKPSVLALLSKMQAALMGVVCIILNIHELCHSFKTASTCAMSCSLLGI